MKSVAVVGGGISGLSIAKMLGTNYQVSIFEKENEVGGLLKCQKVDGHLFHKVGGQIFNSKNQEVLNWFWSFFNKDLEFIKADRKSVV